VKKRILILLPVWGIIIFTFLYFIASLLYQGGSQVDENAIGFSWINNYWCDLLSQKTYNGQLNPGRPFAMIGMLLVCLALAHFWYIFPNYVNFSRTGKLLVQISGMMSMLIALFISTQYHDIVIYAASFLGLVALIGTFVGLIKLKWYFLFWFGVFNLIILLVDHYIYYTREFIAYLPIIQKINFAALLIWFCLISINLYTVVELRNMPD